VRAWAPAMPERVAAAPGAPGAVMAARAWRSVLKSFPVKVILSSWFVVVKPEAVYTELDELMSPLDQSETTTTIRPPVVEAKDKLVAVATEVVEAAPLLPGVYAYWQTLREV